MKRLLIGLMALSLLVLFGVRVGLMLRSERTHKVEPQNNVELVGVVVGDPEERDTSLHATVALPSGAKLLAILPRSTELSYGDTVRLKGDIVEPQTFVTNTGRIFDYPGYLRVRGIGALMRYATLENRVEAPWSVQGTLYEIKHTFEHSIEQVLPEPQAGLFEGIFLGERRGLPESLTTAFIVASLIHIVVLSGYNISIVGEAVLRGLKFLPRTASFIIGATLMILFVLMTGASSTSIRAGLMALIAILARYLHRPGAALRALALAALAMIFWNPLIVLYDTSFILSIIATFGLIALAPAVEAKLPRWLARYPQLHSIAASTIAVQIFILPALLYFTGILSLVALPANILVLPVVSFIMFLGFVSGLLGMINGALAFIPAFVTDMLLRYAIHVAEFFASLPLASVTIPAFPAWVALLIYVPLSFSAWLLYRRNAAQRPSN